MSEQLLELVFYGELEPGADLAKTKAQMGQLFKASEAQIDKMFSGQRVVLKSKLDQVTADKYIAALKARGAACKVEPVGGAAIPTASEPAQSIPSSSDSGQTGPSPASSPTSASSTSSKQTSPQDGLPIAGEKVDEVLAHSHLSVEPVGVDLSDEHEDAPAPDLKMQDSLSIAPVGSDLGEEKKEKKAVVPDISHLKLDED